MWYHALLTCYLLRVSLPLALYRCACHVPFGPSCHLRVTSHGLPICMLLFTCCRSRVCCQLENGAVSTDDRAHAVFTREVDRYDTAAITVHQPVGDNHRPEINLVGLLLSLRFLWPFQWKPRRWCVKSRGNRVLGVPCRRLISYPGSVWRVNACVGWGRVGAGAIKASTYETL